MKKGPPIVKLSLLPDVSAQVCPGHLLPLNHILLYAGTENSFVVASRSCKPC
jgi:hypothetical protein